MRWVHSNPAQLTHSVAALAPKVYYGMSNLADLAESWLQTGPGLSADIYADGVIDFKDFAVIADKWLEE